MRLYLIAMAIAGVVIVLVSLYARGQEAGPPKPIQIEPFETPKPRCFPSEECDWGKNDKVNFYGTICEVPECQYVPFIDDGKKVRCSARREGAHMRCRTIAGCIREINHYFELHPSCNAKAWSVTGTPAH